MRIRGWQADIAAFIAGMVLPLAFAPVGWWPLAIVSLLLFHYLVEQDGLWHALRRAFLFGLGYFGIGISWVYVSVSLFGNASPPLAAFITLLLVLIMSLYIALTGLLVNRIQPGGSLKIFVLPSAWIFAEWLRGWLFTGFGWLGIGYSFIDTPLAAYAPFVGVLGISFLALLSISGLYVSVTPRTGAGARIAGVVVILLIWLPPLMIRFPGSVQFQSTPVEVALVQGNIPQHLKWQAVVREPTLQWYRQATEAHWDSDLVIWPETAIPAYEDQVFEYLDAMHLAARRNNTLVMLGIPVRESHGERYYNALAVLGDETRGPDSIYLKRHLVPFGEYLPMKSLLDPVLGFLKIPMSNFSAGDQESPLVSAGADQVGAFICFEIAFADEVREAMPHAAYLVNISNDAWFGDSLAPAQHLQMARMRALESGRYVLRATNTGITAIIGPDGTVQKVLPQFKAGTLTGSILRASGQTPYNLSGDYPLLILAGLLLIVLWRSAFRSRQLQV